MSTTGNMTIARLQIQEILTHVANVEGRFDSPEEAEYLLEKVREYLLNAVDWESVGDTDSSCDSMNVQEGLEAIQNMQAVELYWWYHMDQTPSHVCRALGHCTVVSVLG